MKSEKERKILFFDIDGTLLTAPPKSRIPDSTLQALKEAHENGHLLFINSGRTWAMLPPAVKELDFDGYVCGCGSQIYLNGKSIHYSTLPHDLCVQTVQMVQDCKVSAFFECKDRILYNTSGRVHKAINQMKDRLPTADIAEFDEEEAASYTFDKFLVFLDPDSDSERFMTFCKEHFSLFNHQNDVWEITQKNCSKGTAIDVLLKHFGMSLEDSFAFGDSHNDLPMLQYAGNSIAMGNSDPEILPFCTWQTTDIEDNGIRNALLHFGLI